MFKSLREIKGVGEKVHKRLVEHFGSEEEALRALEDQEFYELLLIGVPFHKAVVIAKDVYSKKNSFAYCNILMTPEAREIFSSISSLLREHACTDYGRLKLSLFYPTKDEEEIKRRLQLVREAVKLVSSLPGEKLMEVKARRRELQPLQKIKKSRITGSVLVTEDQELYEELRTRYSDLVEVFLLESPGDLEFLGDYALIRYIPSSKSDLLHVVESLPRAIILHSTEEEEILPEAVLSSFIGNRGSIKACYEVLRMMGGGEDKAYEELGEAVRAIEALCEPVESCGGFASAYKNLRHVAEKCAEEANAELVKRVEEGGYSLAGRDVLKILSTLKEGDVYGAVPPEITGVIADVSVEWEAECAQRLGIEDEALAFSGLFSREDLYPLRIDEKTLSSLDSFLGEEAAKAEFRKNQRDAAFLKTRAKVIRDSIARVLELDFLLALGEFTVKYGGRPAGVIKGLGTAFRGGKHLLLRKKEIEGETKVQPVDYVLGESSLDFKGAKGERVAVITGANSGGKTTLLETIAQVQMMAQSGLPVLAEEAAVSLMDEVYYYGRRRSDTSAGAFEALLRSLAGIHGRKGRRLVLADEIEAITEPGAAAKILAALLEVFGKEESCIAGVVTHLGEDLKGLSVAVRVDGIEASGLDEDMNLIVDRNPVLNKIARSTPELIVERLSKSDEKRADFYRAILKKFK